MSNERKIKTAVIAQSNLTVQQFLILSGLTASRALYLDSSNQIAASVTTSTELAYLSGVTSAVQTQLNAKESTANKGVAGGYASLDGGGKVPVAQLPSALMTFEGMWDASTNTPTLSNGTGDTGMVYEVSVAGIVDFGAGNITFAVGDWTIYNDSGIWEKSTNSNAVTSVNGLIGTVVLTTTNIAEGTAQYFTDERAQDAVGGALTDTASVDFTYNDAGNTISAAVLPAGVDHDSLANYVADKHIAHSGVTISGASNGGLSGGGTIAASRTLSIDITNAIAETSADNADLIAIYDNSATALRKMTRANFLSGISLSSSGDISETSFSGANNQSSAANVTGLSFSNAVVRSFYVQVSIFLDAATDAYEVYSLHGIQKGANWEMSQESTGDDTGVVFSITSGGQVQYTSGNAASFVSLSFRFRAITTSV